MPTQHQLFFLLCFSLILLFSCQDNSQNQEEKVETAAPTNTPDSDPKAIAIAEEAMTALGGKKNWENTRHISWVFFGNRKHTWDKQTGNVRIDYLKEDMTVLLNLNDDTGKIEKEGVMIENPDSLKPYLEKGKEAWINDSYWLVMPYKLRDPGVNLQYVKADTTMKGKQADVLQLTFEEVGVTPENKYWIYVNQDDKMVSQWDFYGKATDTVPRFQIPWLDYKKYGNIMLSGNRERAQLTDISVADELPESVYKEF